MGRPTKVLTEAQKAEVETLAAVLNAAQMADYFAIGRTTFFAMMERDKKIAERYKRGKARAIGAIAQGLIAKARGGDTASMIFYLKTQAGWRETTAVEHAVVEHAVVDRVEPDVAFLALAALLDGRATMTETGAITLSATAQDIVRVETGSQSTAPTQTPAGE